MSDQKVSIQLAMHQVLLTYLFKVLEKDFMRSQKHHQSSSVAQVGLAVEWQECF